MITETDPSHHNSLFIPSKAIDHLSPALYIVATPIGNLRDITLRALHTLAAVDIIACEDTRITQQLLQHYHIRSKLICYNDHSKAKDRAYLLDHITQGKSVALVSDAGTPLISDPGYKLVKDALAQAIHVETIPGVSSVITALTLGGMPTDRFFFQGFLPPKRSATTKLLQTLRTIEATLVIFETSRRLLDNLILLQETLGDRSIVLLRELTKKFEEVHPAATISELHQHYHHEGLPKGELILLIEGAGSVDTSSNALHDLLTEYLTQHSVKEAVSYVSDITGISKKEVYKHALQIKSSSLPS